MKNDIYIITVLAFIPPYLDDTVSQEDKPDHLKRFNARGGMHSIGWFKSLKEAIKVVENNDYDIHECSYEYAIIEKVPEGLYGTSNLDITEQSEYWYKWNDDLKMYIKINKPKTLKGIIGWSI